MAEHFRILASTSKSHAHLSITVTIPYDIRWLALDWAKENYPSYITNEYHQDGYYTYDKNKIDYFFADKKDAVMFALRWTS